MQNKTYLIFPKILTGKDAEDWKTGRRRIFKEYAKGSIIDGIIPSSYFVGSYTATINPDFLRPLSEV